MQHFRKVIVINNVKQWQCNHIHTIDDTTVNTRCIVDEHFIRYAA